MPTDSAAEEHLRAIRLLMEHATTYRAISAPTALVGGVLSTALAGTMLLWQNGDGSRNLDAQFFYAAWLLVFIATLAANMLLLWRGAQERGEAMVSASLKLAVRSIVPAFFAGVVTSSVLTLTTRLALFPTLMWVVFYGLGLLATMSFAPRSIIALGWAFLFTGAAAFIYFVFVGVEPEFDLPTPTRFYPAAMMGATFGIYHLIYAAWTWPRRAPAVEAAACRPLVSDHFTPQP